ncbi:hypothetical protein [Collinsella aerofaciens]|uniref:hypothetical protein n=1 Tax=Collinsella aerofaciens TaxID=74426 RepID=UPI003D7A0CBB
MNTDMNLENVNPDNPEDINADTEDTQLMDAPDEHDGADVTAELPIAKDLEDAVAADSVNSAADEPQAPKSPRSLKRKLVAGGVALAIVAALGIGLSLNHEAVNIPDNAPVASLVGGKEDAKTYPASVTLEADGWNDGDGEFSYEVVDADGKAAAKGDIVPGKEASVDLPKGAYALNVTSIPTAKDGKTTWLVPDAVDFVVEGEGVSVKVSLAKVDMTDQAAVDAAIEKLPEEERAAAKKLIEAKRENPNATAVSAPVSKPSSSTVQQAAASKPSGSNKNDSKPASKPSSGSSSNKNDSKPSSGSGSSSNKPASKPSGSSGSNKNDKDDKPASKPSGSGNSGSNSGSDSGSSKPSKPAEPEKVWAVVTPAWDEQIYHPAVTHVEKKKVGVQYMADDGKLFLNEIECSDYCWENGLQYSCLPRYEDVTVTDQAAWTETVHHDAVYGWVNK